MGFLSGRVTFTRLQLAGRPPGIFGPEHLEPLTKNAAGRKRRMADGVELGWTAGDHILDTRFSLEKNIVNEALLFCLRVDAQKIPSDLQRAYYQIELDGLMKSARNGDRISIRQKREARDAARERLQDEAKDGRFTRRKSIPVLWDARSNELLAGTTSATAIEQLHGLFEESFGVRFEPITAGARAYQLAELRRQSRAVDDAVPSSFLPGTTPADIAWIPMEDSRDFVGNEFMLWLWHTLDEVADTIRLTDNSQATVMLARTLTLECPKGQTGTETIRSEAPTRLPEAFRAIQAGKWPRKVGVTAVRHDQQYDLTLQAETLAVSGAKLPPPPDENDRARLEGRIDQIRQLIETLDLLYDAFGRIRFSADWPKELTKMQKWLAGVDRASRRG